MLNIVRAFCCVAASEFIPLAFFSPVKLQAAFKPPQLHLLIGFVSVAVIELPANGRQFSPFLLLEGCVTCPRQSIKEFKFLEA